MNEEYKDICNPLIKEFADSINYFNIISDDNEEKMSKRLMENEKIDDIVIYLYIMLLTMTNQNYVPNINSIDDFKNIEFIENDNNYIPGTHNKKILNFIRNSFAHGSGSITESGEKLIISNNKSYGKTTHNCKIVIDKKTLIEIFSKSLENNKNINEIYDIIFKSIEELQRKNTKNIPKEIGQLVLLHLMLCYNKEGIIDKYLEKQYSFFNCKDFEIKTLSGWKREIALNMVFEKYNLLFDTKEDKKSYNNEWKNFVSKSKIKEGKQIYNINNMAVDNYGRHIPNQVLFSHIRNAMSHGYIKLENEHIIFYDKQKANQEPIIEIKTSKKQLQKFLCNDVFYESLYTNIDTFKNNRDHNMYYFERATSANDFKQYINIYRLRFPNLNEKEVLYYMINNNKIYSFLLDFPNQYNNFLNYTLASGENLVEIIKSMDKKENRYTQQYAEELKKQNKQDRVMIQKLIMEDANKKSDYFLRAYAVYLLNRNRIYDLYDLNNLNEEQSKIIDIKAKKLYKELEFESLKPLNYTYIDMNTLMKTNITKEVSTIIFERNSVDLLLDYMLMNDEKSYINEPVKYTVKNIEHYTSLNDIKFKSYLENIKNMKIKDIISSSLVIGAASISVVHLILKEIGIYDNITPIMALDIFHNSVLIRSTMLISAYLIHNAERAKNFFLKIKAYNALHEAPENIFNEEKRK